MTYLYFIFMNFFCEVVLELLCVYNHQKWFKKLEYINIESLSVVLSKKMKLHRIWEKEFNIAV